MSDPYDYLASDAWRSDESTEDMVLKTHVAANGDVHILGRRLAEQLAEIERLRAENHNLRTGWLNGLDAISNLLQRLERPRESCDE